MKCNKFFTGVAIGAVLGVLFAPEKGATTRRKIKNTYDDLKDQLDHLLGKENEELDELLEKLENKAEAITDETRDKLLKLLSSAKSSL